MGRLYCFPIFQAACGFSLVSKSSCKDQHIKIHHKEQVSPSLFSYSSAMNENKWLHGRREIILKTNDTPSGCNWSVR